ncbi:MAG: cytochrome c oxidase assembly factor Coa1 family protein [Verrucomicrobiota bacterium]
MPQLPPSGWWNRNWKWVVPVSVVTALCLFIGSILLLVSTVFGMIKSAAPYKDALAKAVANPQVQSALGTPVSDGFFVSGSISSAGASGSATMDIPISGPKGEGTLHVEAKKSAGVWTYSTLEVAVPGQPERIQLPR